MENLCKETKCWDRKKERNERDCERDPNGESLLSVSGKCNFLIMIKCLHQSLKETRFRNRGQKESEAWRQKEI